MSLTNSNSSVTDIEGNTYITTKIAGSEWMIENLRTRKYNDGTPIKKEPDPTLWQNATTGLWALYDNQISNNITYGKLYNWIAVETGKLCPVGWHVPSEMNGLTWRHNSVVSRYQEGL